MMRPLQTSVQFVIAKLTLFHVFVVVFFKITFFEISFWTTARLSKGLDPDQDRRSVGPDLDPNRLQRLSAGDTSREGVVALFERSVPFVFVTIQSDSFWSVLLC